MSDEDEVFHCAVDKPVDLRAALEAAAIEYLDIDDQRTIVIYQQAILILIVTSGQATAAREFDAELWEEPPGGSARGTGTLTSAFLDELLSTTDADRLES